MSIWLPTPLYRLKPLLFLLGGALLVTQTQNPWALLVAAMAGVHAARITWLRFQWQGAE